MHIHHKNMKYLCSSSEAWLQQNLSYLGIHEFGCNFIDLEHNTYFPLGSNYGHYCEFMEKKLHHDMASRIQPDIRLWSPSEALYQVKESLINANDVEIPEPSMPALHAIDWTVKTETGLEMFYMLSDRPLQSHQMHMIKRWMHVFAYEGAQIKKYKPKASLELENREALLEKFINFDAQETYSPMPFQKAKFGDVVLTGKEQEYIQHLVLQRPYREIAAKYQVTEVAVRKVIHNIKRKLGCPNMSISEMFSRLNECGALGVCMQSIQKL